LRVCLKKLSPRQREAVSDRYLGSVSVQDIAQRQGTTANAISKLLQRSRLSLLKCIERTLGEEDQR